MSTQSNDYYYTKKFVYGCIFASTAYYFAVPAITNIMGFGPSGIVHGSLASSLMSRLAVGGITRSGGIVALSQSTGHLQAIYKSTAILAGCATTFCVMKSNEVPAMVACGTAFSKTIFNFVRRIFLMCLNLSRQLLYQGQQFINSSCLLMFPAYQTPFLQTF